VICGALSLEAWHYLVPNSRQFRSGFTTRAMEQIEVHY
jgi:hypothetical protein